MADRVRIGDQWVGDGEPCFVVAEVGINHNGDLDIARRLISAGLLAGCDAIKFQKRTIEYVYTPEELARPRETPFGKTNADLKRALEFDYEEYNTIDEYCKQHNIMWYASCWDKASVDFIEQFDPPCYKIASACLTDDELLCHHRKYGRSIILSTGMSTLDQIDRAVELLGTEDLVLMHCTSTYPAKPEELNLRVIQTLRERYDVPIGYSGHEVGLATTCAANVLGACMVERHITLDRAMWGSDQAASVEPYGFSRLVRDIRVMETAMGDGVKHVYESEIPSMNKLRRVGLQKVA
jgi:N-acetylneuraminate synthase